MRILLVTHYFPARRGGIETAAAELAKGFATRGIEVVWAASDPPPDQIREGILPIPMKSMGIVERMTGFAFPLWTSASLVRLFREAKRCDIVHIHDCLYPGSLAASLAAFAYKKPLFVTQHTGCIPRAAVDTFSAQIVRATLEIGYRTIGRFVVANCEAMVFISEAVRAEFAGMLAFSKAPLYIPNGLDLSVFHPVGGSERQQIREHLGVPAHAPMLLFVGRFIRRKGLPILKELVADFPDCTWVMVGEGPENPSQWGFEHLRCVEAVDHPKLACYYQAADLLILPSAVEGFPLVVQESMGCGTPALVTPRIIEGCPSARNVLDSCEPTAREFSARLRTLLASKRDLESRRASVATFAADHWAWDRVVDRYLELFDLEPTPMVIA